jgi:predicted phage-related endonuclease
MCGVIDTRRVNFEHDNISKTLQKATGYEKFGRDVTG